MHETSFSTTIIVIMLYRITHIPWCLSVFAHNNMNKNNINYLYLTLCRYNVIFLNIIHFSMRVYKLISHGLHNLTCTYTSATLTKRFVLQNAKRFYLIEMRLFFVMLQKSDPHFRTTGVLNENLQT